jgi:hypothetical protein
VAVVVVAVAAVAVAAAVVAVVVISRHYPRKPFNQRGPTDDLARWGTLPFAGEQT